MGNRGKERQGEEEREEEASYELVERRGKGMRREWEGAGR